MSAMTISIVEPTSKSPSKAAQTIPGVFFEQAARAGEREYLRFFRDGSWQALSWRETAERATRVACGLIAAGLEPGDHVALLSENRVEWLYCDLAILAAGGVTVPIYPSLTARVAGYIAEDSKTPLAIVSNAQLAEKLSGLDHPKQIFKMETDVVEWVQNAPGLEAERELASRLEALRPEAMATVVYTSGTTGDPKGVMLTHRHFVEMGKSALQAFHIGPEDRLLSYLPYSHVLERVDGIFIETMAGSSFWLARGMETLVEDIQAAKPTVMLGVPRVFEKVYEAVFDQVHNQPIYKRAIFRWALGIGAARLHREPGPWLGLRLRIADRLVLDSLRTRLTGGRLRFFISGGAPLNEKVEEFFWSIGVKILQGWGLTESTSGVTSNTEEAPLPDRRKNASRHGDPHRNRRGDPGERARRHARLQEQAGGNRRDDRRWVAQDRRHGIRRRRRLPHDHGPEEGPAQDLGREVHRPAAHRVAAGERPLREGVIGRWRPAAIRGRSDRA